MAFIDLIQQDIIKVPLEGKEKHDIIRELVQVLKDAGKIDNVDEVYDVVMAREDRGSTGLEKGIAVPHSKTTAVDSLTLAIGISPDGVDFEALDDQPSKIFFLMIAPPSQSGPHIEALSEIARICQSDAFVRTLASSSTAEEVVELFSGE